MFQDRYVNLPTIDVNDAVVVTDFIIDRGPDPVEREYTDQQRSNQSRASLRSTLIAAVAASIGGFGQAVTYRGGFFDYSYQTVMTSFDFYRSYAHTDYQFGEWPRKTSVELLKKGHFQQAQQTRWKTLQKRYEKKTKRAKGKVPVYPY